MNNIKHSFLLGEKKQDYHLVKKVVDITFKLYGKDFMLKDVLAANTFTIAEKRRLKNIFHKTLSDLCAWNFTFKCQDGIWSLEESMHDYHHDIKSLLLLLNGKAFSRGATVNTGDLLLIRTLLHKWNEQYHNEWREDRGYEPPPFYLNIDVLYFFSNNLKQRLGKHSIFDFNFVAEFRGAYSDYMSMCIVRIISGLKTPHSIKWPQSLKYKQLITSF